MQKYKTQDKQRKRIVFAIAFLFFGVFLVFFVSGVNDINDIRSIHAKECMMTEVDINKSRNQSRRMFIPQSGRN
jgi:hypothetical protein